MGNSTPPATTSRNSGISCSHLFPDFSSIRNVHAEVRLIPRNLSSFRNQAAFGRRGSAAKSCRRNLPRELLCISGIPGKDGRAIHRQSLIFPEPDRTRMPQAPVVANSFRKFAPEFELPITTGIRGRVPYD